MSSSLGDGKYLLLTTFRKDGTAVPTPVWVAPDGDRLTVWTAADSGKVKRIRQSADVRVGPCDVRGRALGPSMPATAQVLTAQESDHVKDLVRKKYGVPGALALLGSTLRRGRTGTVGLSITLA
jgi:hypothetical protein